MHTLLSVIACKTSDFKVCKECGCINWYENEECHNCGGSKFDESKEAVERWVKFEYEFWIKTEGYTEAEADDVLIDV